jgi:hypothetical protein
MLGARPSLWCGTHPSPRSRFRAGLVRDQVHFFASPSGMRQRSASRERQRHDGADQRRHLVWSFQPGGEQAAARQRRHAGRTRRADPRHFDRSGVSPQRGRRQAGSDGSGLARRYRRRRQFAISHCEPAQGAGRRKRQRTLHCHFLRPGLLLCRPDLDIDRSAQRKRDDRRHFPARQSSRPFGTNGRPGRWHSRAFDPVGGIALRHDRRPGRCRQNHDRGRCRT